MKANAEVGPDAFTCKECLSGCLIKEVYAMHVDIKDELKHEPAWAFLYAAFFIGIVVFALLSGGFMG